MASKQQTARVKASLFEIVRDTNRASGSTKQQLSGYVNVDDDLPSLEALKKLCSMNIVDKIVIVYHDYAFSLMGVSLTESNVNPPTVILGTTYKFCAKDIQLERLSEL